LIFVTVKKLIIFYFFSVVQSQFTSFANCESDKYAAIKLWFHLVMSKPLLTVKTVHNPKKFTVFHRSTLPP